MGREEGKGLVGQGRGFEEGAGQVWGFEEVAG